MNENANLTWLNGYAQDTTYFKDVPITFPLLYDEMDDPITHGQTFLTYESSPDLVPSIFLIDQTGLIHIRSDGIDQVDPFLEELEIIISTIDDLLANPPQGGLASGISHEE